MLKEERFEHILKQLKLANKVFFEELANGLSVSEDTIRRDIEILHKSGLLVKVRGGAISVNLNPLTFQDRIGVFSDAKKTIALKAQQVLQGARTIFMDGGTTILALAASIPLNANFRLVTNNMALVPVLSAHEGIEMVVLGGTYNKQTKTTVGIQTCQEAQQYQADIYLMGTCAIDSQIGITASLREEADVKKAFLQSAFKTVVLGNYEKLGTVDFVKVAKLSEIDTLITELPSNDKRLDAYRKFDLEIL